MPHNQNKVIRFNRAILDIQPRSLSSLSREEFDLSVHQLREEIDEMEKAYNENDFVGVVDGLIDLDFFQKGVLYKMGIDKLLYDDCFHLVYQANMDKQLGVKEGREGFGNASDAVKPEGWIPPEERIARRLKSRKLIPELLVLRGKYNFKHQSDLLLYVGYNFSGNGYWYQFEKIEEPGQVWCEMQEQDLQLLEETI